MKRQYMIAMLMMGALLFVTGCIVVPVRGVTKSDRDGSAHGKTATIRVSPPLVVVSDDPDLIIIPGTYVYVIDGTDDDVYFYGGVWWRYWDRSWYKAEIYHGNWIEIEIGHVPRQVSHISSDWKRKHRDAPRVKWHDTRSHWKKWENDRYWEKKKWRR